MTESKGWDWDKADHLYWLKPADDVYALAHKWAELGYKRILDLGCGLGRHSIYFAEQGFEVSALDISPAAIDYLKSWSEDKKLTIDMKLGDILSLPYEDNSFDGVLAYHSISHGDTANMRQIVHEIQRVLRTDGEVFASFGAKDSWVYAQSGYPRLDDNTVIYKEEGPEYDVPHFYANLEDMKELFHEFYISRIRHIDYCYEDTGKVFSKYYYINARKK